MNNDAEYLMHMTAAEKAAYNRKYYQRNKQYWVDYYKTGHGIGRNGGNSHTVGRSAGGGGSHWEPAKRTSSGGGSHWEPAKRTGGGYHYGNENTLNDLYKDFPMSSKKSNSAQPQPKKKKELLESPVTKIRKSNNLVKVNDSLFETTPKTATESQRPNKLLQNPVTQIRRANNIVKINNDLFEKKKELGVSRRPVNQNDARRTGSSSGIHPAVLDQFDRVLRNQTLRKQLGENAESSARRWVSNEQNERSAATARAMDEARRKGLSNLYGKGVNRTRTVNVPTKTESGSAMNPPVYKGKQGHWNENAERVTSATRSFLSNIKNTIANAAKGATQTIARSAENGRKYASSMFSSVKATVGDIKREANDLISRAKKTLDEVMSGDMKFQYTVSVYPDNDPNNVGYIYRNDLKGILQPMSESEALRFVNKGEEPRPWTLQDYQNEKKRRKAKKY